MNPSERAFSLCVETLSECQRAKAELLEALEDLLEAIPKQTNDADWWPDELTQAVRAAKTAIAKAEVSQ